MKSKQNLLLGVLFLVVIVISLVGGALGDRLLGYRILDKWLPRGQGLLAPQGQSGTVNQRILTEESTVIDVVDRVSPSVITVSIKKTQVVNTNPFGDFFDPFGFFNLPQQGQQQQPQNIEQNIGSGFILTSDGMLVTNKHVVADTEAQYKVITKDNKEYNVDKIYRDPVNDLAILKINANGLQAIEFGDSDKLKVGQFVIAIGTALGEFRNTVTTGVVSGLGRGITAGSVFEGSSEQLDNVIQTDAAINPGNSGGPLLNSLGQVIGVNVAVSSQGQNIGFALPINIVRQSVDEFNKTGKFERAYLGVRYKMISRDLSLMNEIPQGAYVVEVIDASPAQKAGVKSGDIITKIDNTKMSDDETNGLAKIISSKRPGERVTLEIWRDGKTSTLNVVLEQSK
jgi:serine protease Do